MATHEEKLERYADLIVNIGVQLQKGQKLVVNATTDSLDLVRAIARKGYEAGAYLVKVNWNDDTISRLRYDHADDAAFLEEPKWYAGEMVELAEQNAAVVSVVSSDPDLLKGVPQERIVNHQKTYGKTMSLYRQYTLSNKFSWCVVANPSPAWAAKVFPDLPQEEQIAKLWDAIFAAVRADREDPVAAWQEHIRTLNQKADYLNGKQYKRLHYVGPGTDLFVGLPEGHIWVAADSANEKGDAFVANLPTEEVFTAPLASDVNGHVSSTKPLSYGGNLIDGFMLTFENGRIVDVKAEKGEDTLKNLVEMDEGSHYLGEVALVPHFSPISQSGILYYNTLFDENASNHFAIGAAYPFCLKGGTAMSQEELKSRGLNNSMTHVDFMVGSAEMDIYGVTDDGKEEQIFRHGDWAI